jgi:hypothetical protein
MFIILNWYDDETIASIVCKRNGNGEPLIFNSKKGAENYAEDNLSGYWQVKEV